MRIMLRVAISHSDYPLRLYREVDWPAVPAVGDRVRLMNPRGELAMAKVVDILWNTDGVPEVDCGEPPESPGLSVGLLQGSGWTVE